jgi:hypothetical protein
MTIKFISGREENPNGRYRIFGIGTVVKTPHGTVGQVIAIFRKRLRIKILATGDLRFYHPVDLEIIK